jgi:hypothetical protein
MQAVAVGGAPRRNGGALEHAATHGYTSGSSTNRRIQMTNGAGAMPIYDRVIVRPAGACVARALAGPSAGVSRIGYPDRARPDSP